MSLETRLDSLHRRVRMVKPLYLFTLFCRTVLAISFIPSGMTKLLGYRFSLMSVDTPVGYFFDSFYQTGGWYRFVGFCQVMAAVLLLIPRTATLGAVVFLPIVLNVMLVTVFVGFGGTWTITSLMLLANVYLICWDYDRIKFILPFATRGDISVTARKYLPLTILGSGVGVLAYFFFSAITTYFGSLGLWGVVGGAFIGGVFGYLNAKGLYSELKLISRDQTIEL